MENKSMIKRILTLANLSIFALPSCSCLNTISIGFQEGEAPSLGISSALRTKRIQDLDCQFEFHIGEVKGRTQLLKEVDYPLAYFVHTCVYDISKSTSYFNQFDELPDFPNNDDWYYEFEYPSSIFSSKIVFNKYLNVSFSFSKVVESNLTEGWIGFCCNILNTNYLGTIDSFLYYGDINGGGIGGVFWLKFEILHNKYVLFSE